MKIKLELETESGVMGILGILDEVAYLLRKRMDTVEADLSDDLPEDYTLDYSQCIGDAFLKVIDTSYESD